jgi:DNA-binding NarL/FixJ family response regulator
MIRVFIYDDSNARIESLETLMEFTNNLICVGSANNCSNVARDMEDTYPDIVLMDVEMPVVDGVQGVRQIKALFPQIKVIMQTVYEDNYKTFNAFRNGASGFMIKNASIQQIVDCIEMVNEGHFFITPSVAIQCIEYISKSSGSNQNEKQLTNDELNTLQLIAQGYSNKVIIEKLSITDEKLNSIMKSIFSKLQAI